MALPTLTQNKSIESSKLHVYLRLAATDLSDFDAASVTTAIGAANALHFKNVEEGFTIEEADGNTIVNSIGQTIVLDMNTTGEFNVLGLTAADYAELRLDSTDKIQGVNVDLIFVEAPANRTEHTVVAGDDVYVVYAVKANVKLVMGGSGTPTKVTISFELNSLPSAPAIKSFTVIA
jgi:hypothetical protein